MTDRIVLPLREFCDDDRHATPCMQPCLACVRECSGVTLSAAQVVEKHPGEYRLEGEGA